MRKTRQNKNRLKTSDMAVSSRKSRTSERLRISERLRTAELKTPGKPTKSRTNIFNLPQEIVLIIAAYLNLDDVKEFRCTCKYFYQLMGCKTVMGRMKVVPSSFQSQLLTFLTNNMGGKFVCLYLTNIEFDHVKKILRHGPNLTGLGIKIQHLYKGLEEVCPNLEYLQLDVSEPFKYVGRRKLSFYFNCLSELSNLSTIVLSGKSNNDNNPGLLRDEESVFSSEAILSIMEHTPQIKAIKFQHMHLLIRNQNVFSNYMLAFDHINFWSFYHVTTSWTRFKIPSKVKSLNCQFTNFVPIDATHTNLEKVIIITKQAIKLDNGAIQVLPNDPESLFWTLYAKIKQGIISVESVDYKFFRVQLFNMPYCTISGFLDTDINGVACSISELYINEQNTIKLTGITCPQTFNNDRLVALLSKVHNLKTLVLEHLDDVTVEFMDDVEFENMDTMILKNCKNLSKSIVDEKLKNLESEPTYDVVVRV